MNTHTKKTQGQKPTQRKLFVLDTNVLMHDPTCLFRFEEHDVFIPMMTLEELDAHKSGMSDVSRNVRQVSRELDDIVSSYEGEIEDGISLTKVSRELAIGKLYIQTETMKGVLPDSLPSARADNQILAVCKHLKDNTKGRDVILVSKDINMRIKARALDLEAQDYFNDKVLEDSDLLYSGKFNLPHDFWNTHSEMMQVKKEKARSIYRVRGPLCSSLYTNQLVWSDELQLDAIVREVSRERMTFETLIDYTNIKHAVWGITARNREQNFALNLLMDPEIDFVTLVGQAGTGKTLLALAAGLTQVLESKRFMEIIMTRVTVPMGEDIGFLPGTEEDKMTPWMGALEDNLDVLGTNSGGDDILKENGTHKPDNLRGDWGRAATADLVRSRIKIKSLNFMRGRTFLAKYLIIDEAQNLTPKQMKALITRAGPGTKIVCLGNLGQIDTPYLTEGSSGLAYVVDRFKCWQHSGQIILEKGERSRLADHANDVL